MTRSGYTIYLTFLQLPQSLLKLPYHITRISGRPLRLSKLENDLRREKFAPSSGILLGSEHDT